MFDDDFCYDVDGDYSDENGYCDWDPDYGYYWVEYRRALSANKLVDQRQLTQVKSSARRSLQITDDDYCIDDDYYLAGYDGKCLYDENFDDY